MRVTKFALVGDETVDLPITQVSPSDKFILKDISGLGPPDVLVNIGTTTYPQGVYQGSKPQPRQMIATIGLNPDYFSGETVEDLREILYGILGLEIGDFVFEIWNDDVKVAIAPGHVSKFEPAIFSKDPAVQITIECEDSYFSAPDELEVNLTGMSTSTLTVDNIGSVVAGFRLAITLTSNLSSFQLTLDSIPLQVTYAFLSGDQIIFETRDGNRNISRIRSGVEISLLDNITLDNWLKLKRGVNSIGMSSPNFTYDYLEYTPNYLGV